MAPSVLFRRLPAGLDHHRASRRPPRPPVRVGGGTPAAPPAHALERGAPFRLATAGLRTPKPPKHRAPRRTPGSSSICHVGGLERGLCCSWSGRQPASARAANSTSVVASRRLSVNVSSSARRGAAEVEPDHRVKCAAAAADVDQVDVEAAAGSRPDGLDVHHRGFVPAPVIGAGAPARVSAGRVVHDSSSSASSSASSAALRVKNSSRSALVPPHAEAGSLPG
jgi:hypothetical protein